MVIHDAFGYGRDKQSINDRIARAGYLALTPNMYARGGLVRCITRVMKELAAQRGSRARRHPGRPRPPAGHAGMHGPRRIAGFCMGGRFALVMSPKGFGASAPFYGTPARQPGRGARGRMPGGSEFRRPRSHRQGRAGKAAKSDRGQEHHRRYQGLSEAGHSFANELPAQRCCGSPVSATTRRPPRTPG
ncbi:hypothetical protein DKM27_10970, partial [Mycobacterium tuberculosis variant bovis]